MNAPDSHSAIHRKVDVYVDLTPKEMACAFWAWDAKEQADFFACLFHWAGAGLHQQVFHIIKQAEEMARVDNDTDALTALEVFCEHTFKRTG